jgi:hypothetical protein
VLANMSGPAESSFARNLEAHLADAPSQAKLTVHGSIAKHPKEAGETRDQLGYSPKSLMDFRPQILSPLNPFSVPSEPFKLPQSDW